MADTKEPTGEEKKPEEEGISDNWWEERPAAFEPTEFQEGFTAKTVVGALFVGLIMMPGAIYLGLMVGQELGPAAEWTTIILFTEVARRSFTSLRRQELYIIFYMAAALTGTIGGLALSGGPFAGLIWNQYLRQSPAVFNFGIAHLIPDWVAPPPGSQAYIQRTFLHHDWLIPILLMLLGNVLGRMQWIGLGYVLFRTTSDVERLPFPFAPIAAQGATALAEVSQEKESWRWPVFSVGTMIGLVYGLFYVAIPALTSPFISKPLMLIPIPFIDFTQNTEGVLPTARIALGTELGGVLAGFILPYPVVIGQFITAMFSNFFLSPTLYRHHPEMFPTWKHGMNLIQTEMATNFDLWMSIGIGTAVAIAAIGLWTVGKNVAKARMNRAAGTTRSVGAIPEGRGDFPLWLAVGLWFTSTMVYVVLCHFMVPRFPLWIIVIFAFFWSPANSYVSARLIGLVGRGVSIPYLAQATFILSGYKGVDIWFAPMPLYDQGGAAQRFREIELTGTKMTSIIKAEIFLLVVLLGFSFIYWSFFWKGSQIPSASYPYAQTWWPLHAFYQALWATATKPGEEVPYLLKAIKVHYAEVSLGGSLALYWILGAFRVPVFWFYGLISGFTANTAGVIPMFTGALLGRYYFARRFGIKTWRMYTPVLLAGYACGVGLMGMFSIAIAIIFKSVRSLPF